MAGLKKIGTLLLVLVAIGLFSYWIFGSIATTDEVDFSTEIKPILNKHCTTCHGGVKKLGDLSLLFEADAFKAGKSGRPAIVKGDASGSELYRRISHSDAFERMPPEGPGLTNEEINTVKKWINQGAEWGKHWAYVPLEKSSPPTLTSSFSKKFKPWIHNDIDRFVLNKLATIEQGPSEIASPETLLRRLSLDLTGLPPTLVHPENILADLSYEDIPGFIDKLLNSSSLGEHWASMWMDLARYADSKGYEKDGHREIWKYRDWIIQSFNADKPYNEFTLEQIAGDLLPKPTPEQLTATAFHRNTMTNTEGGTDNEEFRVSAVIDRVNTTWEAWMGTSFGCAQCHNHPYDPITQKDYYQFYAFFNNTRDQDLGTEMPTLKFFDTLQLEKIQTIKNWLSKLDEQDPNKIKRSQQYYHDLLHLTEPKITVNDCVEQENEAVNPDIILHYHGGYASFRDISLEGLNKVMVNFSHTTPGKITMHLDKPDGPIISRWNLTKGMSGLHIFDLQPVNGQQKIYLTFDYNNKNYREVSSGIRWFLPFKNLPGQGKPGYREVKHNLLEILKSEPETEVPILQEAQPPFNRKSYVFERGNWLVHGEEVKPAVPNSISPDIQGHRLNRMDLANWIVSAQNPLTARVFVNRVWEQLFGRGLVLTTEDLGTQGESPSHPELLDWLAYRFMHTHEWKLKPLLKEIVSSATYQQTAIVDPEWMAQDPNNEWLARGPKFRLSAEQVRDQALFAAGLLSNKMYGPSVMPPQPEGIWQVVYSNARWSTSEGEDRYRRALYTYWRRTSPYPSMISFDSPSREFCVSRRVRTNTPLQALVTLNDPVYIEASQILAFQMLNSAEQLEESNIGTSINNIYQSILLQPIPKDDLTALLTLYRETQSAYSENLYEAELVLNEFLELHPEKAIDQEKIPHFAALTAVANVLLNLDAVLTKT